MDKVLDLMQDFKNATQRAVDSLKRNEIDGIDELLSLRQNIIDKLDKIDYSEQDFKLISSELNIIELNDHLFALMEEKKLETREELKKITINKSMSKQYSQEGYVDSIYFNKKI